MPFTSTGPSLNIKNISLGYHDAEGQDYSPLHHALVHILYCLLPITPKDWLFWHLSQCDKPLLIVYRENITDVFFDLDHTLWDFDRNSKLAFLRVFEEYEIDLDIHNFMDVYKPINFKYWKMYREGTITKQELRKGRFAEAFRAFDMGFSQEMTETLEVKYIEELPGNNHLFNGARAILKYLSAKYKMHIITNGFDEVQELKLTRSKIAQFFETVTTSEEAGAQKPNPKIFHLALDKAGIKPENGIMIGDTFEADILGAESVGMYTMYYNYRKQNIPKKYVIVNELMGIREYL